MTRVWANAPEGKVIVNRYVDTPCGALAEVDDSGGYPAYRCNTCNALIGSSGMPSECYELYKEERDRENRRTKENLKGLCPRGG